MSIRTVTTLRCDRTGCTSTIRAVNANLPLVKVSQQASEQGWQSLASFWPFSIDMHYCPEHRTDKETSQ